MKGAEPEEPPTDPKKEDADEERPKRSNKGRRNRSGERTSKQLKGAETRTRSKSARRGEYNAEEERQRKLKDLGEQYVQPKYLPQEIKSYYDAYNYGDWKWKKTQLFVTENTKVPPMPKELLKQPNEANYNKQQVEVEDKIDALSKQLVSIAYG